MGCGLRRFGIWDTSHSDMGYFNKLFDGWVINKIFKINIMKKNLNKKNETSFLFKNISSFKILKFLKNNFFFNDF